MMGFESFDKPTIAWVVRFPCWQVSCDLDLWRLVVICEGFCKREWTWVVICEPMKENKGEGEGRLWYVTLGCDMWNFWSVKLWKKMKVGVICEVSELWNCERKWRRVVICEFFVEENKGGLWSAKENGGTMEKKRKKKSFILERKNNI